MSTCKMVSNGKKYLNFSFSCFIGTVMITNFPFIVKRNTTKLFLETAINRLFSNKNRFISRKKKYFHFNYYTNRQFLLLTKENQKETITWKFVSTFSWEQTVKKIHIIDQSFSHYFFLPLVFLFCVKMYRFFSKLPKLLLESYLSCFATTTVWIV